MTQLAVPLHQQDLDQFCGPATAQMILGPIINQLVGQGELHATILKSKSPADKCQLITSPMQLADALNATQQSHGGPVRPFQAYYFEKQKDGANATAVILQTLRQGIAAAALVQCGGHWVVVTGATTPSDDSDGLQPDALFVNNPWPPVPNSLPAPPPHVDLTDGCGGGGVRGQAEQIPIDAWYQDPNFTPVTMCPEGSPLQPPLYIVVGAAGLCAAVLPVGVP